MTTAPDTTVGAQQSEAHLRLVMDHVVAAFEALLARHELVLGEGSKAAPGGPDDDRS